MTRARLELKQGSVFLVLHVCSMTFSRESSDFAGFAVWTCNFIGFWAPFGEMPGRDFQFGWGFLLSNFCMWFRGGEAGVRPGDEDVQFGYALSCDVARMMTTARMRRMMMLRKGSAFLDRPA